MTLPNTLIVGMGRSGTTALVRALNSHPNAWFVSNRTKYEMKDYITHNEMHFFTHPDRYEKGLEWYAEFFKEGEGSKIIGEKTPSYFNKPAIGRIRNDLGAKMKIILCVREPVDRTYSQWAHLNQKGMSYGPTWEDYKDVPFEDCIRLDIEKYAKNGELFWDKDNPHYKSQLLHNSNYYWTIRDLYELWDKSQIHVVVAEALRHNAQEEFDRLTDWLEIERHKLPKWTQKPTNCSTFKKITGKAGGHLTEGEYWMRMESNKQIVTNNIDPETAEFLRVYFGDMKKELYKLINRNITEWE